jgi:class 3 adenylate cyclase
VEPQEKRLVIILADISGYTRFMVENQLSAIHGQIFITTLIEALLREVDIPLQLQEIEGDAVFLYAAHPGSDHEWKEVLAQVRRKLVRFFDVFIEGMVAAAESTPCKCAICSNAHELSLKIVVHIGQAVFHMIGNRPQVSGPDVILAHRLLKNSVPSNEYLLMSAAAYGELGRDMSLQFVGGKERYDEFGSVETHYHQRVKRSKAHGSRYMRWTRPRWRLERESMPSGHRWARFPRSSCKFVVLPATAAG